MENVNDWKGITGQLVSFKSEVGDSQKITFVGSPGVCTPFAELLAYAVRDRQTYFIPLLDADDCHQFEAKDYAMVLSDEVSNPNDSDARSCHSARDGCNCILFHCPVSPSPFSVLV